MDVQLEEDEGGGLFDFVEEFSFSSLELVRSFSSSDMLSVFFKVVEERGSSVTLGKVPHSQNAIFFSVVRGALDNTPSLSVFVGATLGTFLVFASLLITFFWKEI